ncbi:hypothetical protein BK816_00170 [Boudabousia tangfeifanii]|uniref:Solute-binding protein family 5 domain-containing protein n=1 Tax=Boudabousia tangfeifanii TaxID=1912795 RepID=A0A1D9MHX6_9ACTO|nr:ABC transporter family substrate-binding protein [Boudabousia tangfeifanii]AOZ71897.1 hypothetical protein BK816_00170 [Boudabousia tangfeifanii]
MKRAVKTTAAVLTIAGLFALSGCGTEAKLGKGNEEVQKASADYLHVPYEKLNQGGNLTLPISVLPEQFNPFQGNSTMAAVDLWYWYNPVVTLFDDNGNWQINPDYVTKVEDKVVDGKTVVTYSLNDKAKFNDGTPFDWKVWEGTWKAGSGQDESMVLNDSTGYEPIEKVERGENDFQAVVTYKTVFPWWKKNFNSVMHPKLAAMGADFNDAYLNNPRPEWGAGPFKIGSVDLKAGNISFVPNEKWWGKPTKLDTVYFRALDDKADMAAFRNQEIDLVGVSNKERLSQLDENTPVYTGISMGENVLTLNSKADYLKDINVRKALLKAMDRKTIMNVRFQGMKFEADPLGSLVLFQPQKGYEDNTGDLGKADPEEAKKLLDAAGWKQAEGKEFRTNDKGEELVVRMPSFSTSDTAKAINDTLMALWKNVGIKLDIQQKKPADYPQIVKDRDFDVLYSAFYAENPFGMADICQFYQQGQTLLKSGLGNDEIDKLCLDSVNAKDENEALKLGNKAEKAAMALAGAMPIMNGPAMVATKPGLANFGSMGFAKLAPELIGWTNPETVTAQGK